MNSSGYSYFLLAYLGVLMNSRFLRLLSVQLRRINLRNVHTIAGLLMGLIFIVTGFYLQFNIDGNNDVTASQHMMYRANHIYVLFSSLIHLLMIPYFVSYNALWANRLKYAVSVTLLLSSLLLVLAFIKEPVSGLMDRPLSAWGLYFLLISVLTMLGLFVWEKLISK